MYSGGITDTPTNLALPKTDATLTIRVIKSFEYRTERSLVFHHINLEETTVGQLKEKVRQAIQTQPGWKPYRNTVLGRFESAAACRVDRLTSLEDTLKLYTKAHGAKTTNLIINLDHDEWIFEDDSKVLANLSLENESEVSFFNRQTYEDFKKSPDTKWES